MLRLSLLLMLATTPALLAADLSGSWRGALERDGKKDWISLTLKQQGQDVSGTLTFDSDVSRLTIEKPLVEGNRFTFEVHDGSDHLITFNVTAEGAGLAGDATVGEQTSKIQMAKTSTTPVYRVGGGVSAPVLIHSVEPQYSEEARRARLEGTVVLYAEINANGEATNIRIMRSLGLGLTEKAIECVMQWKFKPGQKNDQPVTVAATLELNFRMKRRPAP